jgi:hypothetical protein
MIPVVELGIDSRDLIIVKGYFSNLIPAAWARSDSGGRLAAAGSGAAPSCDDAPWELIRGRRPVPSKLGLQRGFALWHRNDAGRSFRSPSNGSGRQWRLATNGWFGQNLRTARATFSASSMTWISPTGVADLREALGMVSLAQAATQAQQRGRAVG